MANVPDYSGAYSGSQIDSILQAADGTTTEVNDAKGSYSDLKSRLDADSDASVKGIKVAGTALTPDSDGVVNIPSAGYNQNGAIKTDPTNAGTLTTNGLLQAAEFTYQQYHDTGVNAFVGKGTLENVLAGKGLRIWRGTQEEYNLLTQEQAANYDEFNIY